MERLVPGFVLTSRYRLDHLVAAGGMGQVWAVTDGVLGRTVAVKVMHPQTQEQQALAARFRAEARFAAQISHPNVVEVFDFGEHDGLAYLVMEFIDGPTLAGLLEARGTLPADVVRSVLCQLAGALERAHAHGIVHRDLKPSNVLITPDGYVKLMDFGIAKDVAAGASHTLTGEVLGTTYYISPEQALGDAVTPRSDLYSLGVVGHELLTGAKPFDKGTPIATALAHLEDQPPPLPADTPNDLAGVITSCLAKDPAQRPDSAGAIVTVLARSLLSPAAPLAAALLDGGAGTWSPAEASGPSSTQGWVPTWGRQPNH